MSNAREEIWQGNESSLNKVRMEAHTIMLSVYISFFTQQNIAVKGLWFTYMVWHSCNLFLNRDKLDYKQMNVLLSFLLKVCKWGLFYNEIEQLSKKALDLALGSETPLPHEKALALIMHAQVCLLGKRPLEGTVLYNTVFHNADLAIRYEHLIRKEHNKLQALRQLVRIYEKIGEIYEKVGKKEISQNYFTKAFLLATDEADSPLQAKKIKKRML